MWDPGYQDIDVEEIEIFKNGVLDVATEILQPVEIVKSHTNNWDNCWICNRGFWKNILNMKYGIDTFRLKLSHASGKII